MPALVSILVPSFNASMWIEAALESALAQSWPACEVIVVDDGSTDDSAARAERFQNRGVKVIRQQNRGASAARNRALAASRGTFIQYLDADDILSENKIAVQMAAIERRGPAFVASCAWGRFTDAIAGAEFRPTGVWRDLSPVDFLVACAMEEVMFPPAAWLIPRSACERAGTWREDISLNDDGEYLARVLTACDGIVFCPDARVYYRSGNPTSYGSRHTAVAAASDLRAWHATTATLRRLEDSDRTVKAAATGYQRIQARYFGEHPAIVAEAAREERRLGGGEYRFEGGPIFRLLVRVVGWRNALRLRHARYRAIGATGGRS